MPLPRRLPLRRKLLGTVAVGAASRRTVSPDLDEIIAATPARGRDGYGAMVAALDLALLSAPTLVIAGRQDRITPPHRARLLAEQLPQLIELAELETGHCAPFEAPGDVVALLRRLLPGTVAEAR